MQIFKRTSELLSYACCILLCQTCLPARVGAGPEQLPDEKEFRLLLAGNGPLELTHGFIESGSLVLTVDGILWQQNRDYRLRARSGVIVPLGNWLRDPTSSSPYATVIVRYRFTPVFLAPRQDLWPMASPPHNGKQGSGQRLPIDDATAESQSSGGLQVTGSKTVEVSSGSRREMTVNQNLRLSIVGQLTPDIAVRAFLSDDNLPVIPEGNTEQLRDIDKVLVELVAPSWHATLGDFVARRQGSTYGDYRRKLQGFSLAGAVGATSFEVLGGSPQGVYRTLQIRGQEAQQGPYYLGPNGGAQLFVVAGSERVTLDGQVLTRGSDRDYTIDYIAGTVTFTYRQLITSESDIVVEFEEGEGAFGRTVVGGGAGVQGVVPLLGLAGVFHARIIREQDDPQRLRTGVLSPADEEILRAAGDDPAGAVSEGVQQVPAGTGHYSEQIIGGVLTYLFAPDGGDFDLVFFRVGMGLGDYEFEHLTSAGLPVFQYAGDGSGSYRIGRQLAVPGRQSVATMTADFGDTSASFLQGEWDLGRRDLNVLSSVDDEDNAGGAGEASGRVQTGQLDLGGFRVGRLEMSGSWRQKDNRFQPFQVYKTVFDYGEWGLDDRARRSGFLDQAENESKLGVVWRGGHPGRDLTLEGRYGRLQHGATVGADNTTGILKWNFGGGTGRHRVGTSRADDKVDPLHIRRADTSHRVSWELGPAVPEVSYRRRQWQDEVPGAGGFNLAEMAAGVRSRASAGLRWNFTLEHAVADSLRGGEWDLERDSHTTRIGLTSGLMAGMRVVGEGTLRRVQRPSGADETTRLARVTFSGKWPSLASDWSLGYVVDNSRSAVLDRQIIFVGAGQGDYDSDGHYLGPGRGDHDLALAGTDSLVATTGVVTQLNWRQGFGFLGQDHWFGAWTAQSLLGIDAHSTTDDVRGLMTLHPDVLFDRDQTVFSNLNFSEELSFLQQVRTVDLRTKFSYRETVDRRFAGHPEDASQNTWQVTGSLNLSRRHGLKVRLLSDDDRRYIAAQTLSARRSFVAHSRRLEIGWNYRPTTVVRIGLQTELITRQDDVSGVQQRERALRTTGRARVHKRWTLQGDLRFAGVSSDEPLGSTRPFTFELPGANVETSLRLAWEPSRLMTVSASWLSRQRGARRWQHDVRLETTARF